ncbi:hypothetical protein [Paenibacillus sp. BC26]|uniref:hypothetical protein n=1 Tax=Paenibacillus sp. BC26 TaxID=1881032 RepID=UPI0008F1BE0B|nr:hypothetical protein [Paenibacillus sp. BC26]SFS87577.1 hypothetical protein SAMN05428962_3394 [Paenibacillus sp. BC26]
MLNTIPDHAAIDESAEYHRDTLPQLIALLNLRNSVIGYSLEFMQQCKISRIECFRFDSELADKLAPGHASEYFCGLIAITTNTGAVGAAEFAIPRKDLNCDLVMWASPLQRMKGQTLLESFGYVQSKLESWGSLRSELIASALLKLNGNAEPAAARTEEQRHLWDRSHLLRHTQAFVSF